LRCSHPGRVLLQDYDNRESERMPVPPGKDEHQLVRDAAGELRAPRTTLFAPEAGAPTKTMTPGRASSSSPIAARGLDVPGKRLPRGVGHPRQANSSQRTPGRDEHQLVRDAAGGLAHRASWRAKLFAPGA